MKKMLLFLLPLALVLPVLIAPSLARAADKETDRLQNAGEVIKEIMDIPDDIPQSLIDKADCVIVIPSVLKAAFIVGGSYGRGAMSCRSGDDFQGPWGAPTMMALEGGSFGFQLGGQATDFVLLVMNQRGASSILSSKVKLGADAAAAAGPERPRCAGRYGCHTARRGAHLLSLARPFCRHLAGGLNPASRQ